MNKLTRNLNSSNILTVDVEDWYQGISRYVEVPNPTSRIIDAIGSTIKLLKENNAKATFFVLGEVAERFPEVVESIVSEGHEVGCHSYRHRHLLELDPPTFKKDLDKATAILEKITGEPIVSFRAPLFSITKSTLWALEVIGKRGYLYDSSIVPSFHPFYGIPNESREPHYLPFKTNGESGHQQIMEFPVLTQRLLFFNLTVGGGAYLRFMGKRVLARSIKEANNHGAPAVVYFHPWEIDSFIPEVAFNSAIKLITFYNISKTRSYLNELLKEFKFISIRDYKILNDKDSGCCNSSI
jgi:peptidoglycan-N-acetylglucosamine deacetylase